MEKNSDGMSRDAKGNRIGKIDGCNQQCIGVAHFSSTVNKHELHNWEYLNNEKNMSFFYRVALFNNAIRDISWLRFATRKQRN